MHDSVTFDLCGTDGKVIFPNFRGYTNASLPVDAAAKLVLSSTESPIEKVTVTYSDGRPLVYQVRNIMHDNVDYTPAEYVAEFSLIEAFCEQEAS